MTKKMQQSIILFLLIAAGLYYVYFSLLMRPLRQKYDDSQKNLKETELKFIDMKKRAVELPKLEYEMNMLQSEISELEMSLPKEREVPALLRTFTRFAHKYNLKIVEFTPMEIVSQQNYNEIPFKVTFHGSYHGLAHFLTEIGEEPRILSTKDIVFSSVQYTKETGLTLNISFTFLAYTFKGVK